ncbi:MAG: cell surface protein SprA [Bacteroidales bacterium]
MKQLYTLNRFIAIAALFIFLSISASGYSQRYNSSSANQFKNAAFIRDTLRLSYELKSPFFWNLAATPAKQTEAGMFPEMDYTGDLATGYNRAKLAWYIIDPLFYDTTGNLRPDNVGPDDLSDPWARQVLKDELFPDKSFPGGIPPNMPILNLAYHPSERGPYNFDTDGMEGISEGITSNGRLKAPERRWGGITRRIEKYPYGQEPEKIVSILFWLMDPFVDDLASGGDLYFNYGDISEDVMCDAKMFFEHGIQDPEIPGNNDVSIWGLVPLNPPQNENFGQHSREIQDAGMDGMHNNHEAEFFHEYLAAIETLFGDTSQAYQRALADPSADDYHYFRGSDYDEDPLYSSILERYKHFNGTEGNSPTDQQNPENYPMASTMLPDKEDLDGDNMLDLAENYYQYKIRLYPDEMQVGMNYIDQVYHATGIQLPNGQQTECKWYHFNIPLEMHEKILGNPPQFESCNFMRIFLKGFSEPVTLRFGTLELNRIRNNPRIFDIEVTPNPADTYFKIEFSELVKKQFEFTLTDILGRKVLEDNAEILYYEHRLDVSHIKTGFYVLTITTPDFRFVKKVYIK